nr:MAG TPA: major capsid protein [Caudoviricetes sp.]
MPVQYPSWLPGKPDFSGWATRNDTKCADGVTIRQNAFAEQSGKKVPLVWQHKHEEPVALLGHAYLENRPEGVYAYAYCNDTESGEHAKNVVRHGDVSNFSIFANKLKKIGQNVMHGTIREVSLVLAGANPGATIDVPYIEHVYSDEDITEAYIYHDDDELYVSHSDDGGKMDNRTVGDILDSMTDEQKDAMEFMIQASLEEALSHSDDEDDEEYVYVDEDGNVVDVDDDYDDEDDEEYVYVDEDGNVVDVDDDYDDEDDEEYEEYVYVDEDGNVVDVDEEDDNVRHNVFENDYDVYNDDYISHADFKAVVEEASKSGRSSLEAALNDAFGEDVIQHAFPTNEGGGEQKYGMSNIGYLFPDARMTEEMPGFIKRDTGWVSNFLNAAYRSPFSRIKSVFANITEDEARAKGYVKGKEKTEEVFILLKRVTAPCTVYKKQKIDRDDILDITSFDVVRLIKAEMRIMLDEEIARAALIGDGRAASHPDKVKEDGIRPIAKDADLYNIRVDLTVKTADDSTKRAQTFIDAMIKARKKYKGTGNPTLYITEDMLADLQLMRDTTGRDLFTSMDQIANKLRVKEIVSVPVFDGFKLDTDKPLIAIMVNPYDYGFGTDKGGEVSMFDNFDIDFNQYKYLMETRCSGALRVPYSAITVTMKATA